MKCSEFCLLATGQGKIEPLSTGPVLAGETGAFGPKMLRIDFRRTVFNSSHHFFLEPVVPEETISATAEADCGLVEELQRRAREGGAGETAVFDCPYQKKSFTVFSAKKS